jgi:hypothetical protein
MEILERGLNALFVLQIAPPVDPIDFLYPASAILMGHAQDPFVRPVEVIGDIRYLLVNTIEGVACYPPSSVISTSTSVEQFGQTTLIGSPPSELIRR